MIPLFGRLFAHQAWADGAILSAVRGQAGAGEDEALRKGLHHIALVERGFLALFLERPFDFQKEMQPPASLDELEERFREAHAEQAAFVAGLTEADLERAIKPPWFPGLGLPLADALMQVVMHSQGHRAQCAARLRALGGNPPMTDYIVWVKDQAAAAVA